MGHGRNDAGRREAVRRGIRDRVVELRRVRAGDLAPNPKNWRTHGNPQREALEGVLTEVGYAGALIARKTARGLVLIDGHLRASLDPDQVVPVLVLDVTEAEADKLLATLDPIAAMAGKNQKALEELMAGMRTESAGLAGLLEKLGQKVAGDGGPADAEKEPRKTKIRRGDLLRLGEHRLLCGDSTKPEDVARLMGSEKAVLCQTDPPYGIDFDPGAARDAKASRDGRARKSPKARVVENDGLTGEKLQAFLEATIRAAVPCLMESCAFYIWHPMLTQGTFFAAAAAADILIHRQIIWRKPTHIFGRGDYHWQHELCFYGWRRGHRPPFYGPRNQTTVWDIGYDADRREIDHATPKPVELWHGPMKNHAKRGEICFEPFSGSGSQILAAEKLERRCFAIEIDPSHCQLAVDRWESMTGKRAGRG